MIRGTYVDEDKIGWLAKWWMRANHSKRQEYRGTLRAAMCECEGAQEERDIILTKAEQIHCDFCGKLLDTTPLWGLTKDSQWIEPSSGTRFTVGMQGTTQKEGNRLQSVPSQIPRW